jgi:AI-2 transport protein TqsA
MSSQGTHVSAAPPGGPSGGNALPRVVPVMLCVIGVFAFGFTVRAAAGIVAPTMLALVLTIGVLPVEAWARRHRWPGWTAVLAALFTAYAVLLVMLIGTLVCLVKLVELLPQYTQEAGGLTADAQERLSSIGLGTGTTQEALDKVDLGKVTGLLGDVLSGMLGALSDMFLIVTLIFFFVVAVPGFRPRIAWLRRSRPQLARSLGQFVNGTQSYLVVTALFGAIVGLLDTGALWLIGVPLPLAWGFFSFITNFIPNIGFVIGIIPPALLALLDSGWQDMLWVIVAYSVLNVTIQTFIQPRFVGNSVGLSAEMTFMSLVVWAYLLGALGALLAVPMTLLVRALFLDSDPRAAWSAPLIDAQVDEPEPTPSRAADALPPATAAKPAAT